MSKILKTIIKKFKKQIKSQHLVKYTIVTQITVHSVDQTGASLIVF